MPRRCARQRSGNRTRRSKQQGRHTHSTLAQFKKIIQLGVGSQRAPSSTTNYTSHAEQATRERNDARDPTPCLGRQASTRLVSIVALLAMEHPSPVHAGHMDTIMNLGECGGWVGLARFPNRGFLGSVLTNMPSGIIVRLGDSSLEEGRKSHDEEEVGGAVESKTGDGDDESHVGPLAESKATAAASDTPTPTFSPHETSPLATESAHMMVFPGEYVGPARVCIGPGDVVNVALHGEGCVLATTPHGEELMRYDMGHPSAGPFAVATGTMAFASAPPNDITGAVQVLVVGTRPIPSGSGAEEGTPEGKEDVKGGEGVEVPGFSIPVEHSLPQVVLFITGEARAVVRINWAHVPLSDTCEEPGTGGVLTNPSRRPLRDILAVRLDPETPSHIHVLELGASSLQVYACALIRNQVTGDPSILPWTAELKWHHEIPLPTTNAVDFDFTPSTPHALLVADATRHQVLVCDPATGVPLGAASVPFPITLSAKPAEGVWVLAGLSARASTEAEHVPEAQVPTVIANVLPEMFLAEV